MCVAIGLQVALLLQGGMGILTLMDRFLGASIIGFTAYLEVIGVVWGYGKTQH